MANVISVAGAVGRGQDRKEREPTIMETVLQGLQIANNAYGLKSQYDQNQRADAAAERVTKDDQRKAAGQMTPQEILDAEKTHTFSTEPPKDGKGIKITNLADGSTLYGAVRKAQEAPKTREIKTRTPQGGEKIEIVEDKPGQTFESAPEVKEQGNLVWQDVVDDATGELVKLGLDPKTGNPVKRYKVQNTAQMNIDAKTAEKEQERAEAERGLFVPTYNAIARSPKHADDFRRLIVANKSSQDLINEIKKLGEGVTVFDKDRTNKINSNLVLLAGRLREPVLGPGQMTQEEYERLMGAVGNPAALFSVEENQQSLLDNLSRNIKASQDIAAQEYLINPVFESKPSEKPPIPPDVAAKALLERNKAREAQQKPQQKGGIRVPGR